LVQNNLRNQLTCFHKGHQGTILPQLKWEGLHVTVQRLQATHGNPMSKNKHAKKSNPVSLFVFNGGGQIKMLQAISDVTIEQTMWGSCLMLVAKVHAVLQNIHGSTIRLRAPLSRDDGTGDQSLAMMEDVAATDIVHNAGGRCTVTDPAVHGER
jgi:hypothetical protein